MYISALWRAARTSGDWPSFTFSAMMAACSLLLLGVFRVIAGAPHDRMDYAALGAMAASASITLAMMIGYGHAVFRHARSLVPFVRQIDGRRGSTTNSGMLMAGALMFCAMLVWGYYEYR